MEYTTKKLENSYSRLVNDAIKLISYNPKNVMIYGSGALKASLFAGDIDLFETIDIKAKTKEEASKKMVKIMQNINNKIENSKISVVTDVKAGLYTVYANILNSLGKIKNGKIINYNPKKIKKMIEETFPDKEFKESTKNLYTPSVKQMLKLVKNKPTLAEFLELQEIIRQVATIRWDQDDITNGYTIIFDPTNNNEEKIYLWKAILKNKAPIKIDMLYPISDRLIEVTNFFVFNWIDSNGKKHNINGTTGTKQDFILSLKDQVNKLINSKDKNYLKALKRVATILRQEKDYKTLDKIMSILQGNCGLLYQVIGDIKALLLYISTGVSLPKKYILNEIDIFRSRLSNIYEFKFDEEKVDNEIIKILNHKFNKKFISKKLDNIVNILKQVLNKETKKQIDSIKFNFNKYLP